MAFAVAVVLVIGSIMWAIGCYVFVSRIFAPRWLRIDDSTPTAAVTRSDGVDFVPTRWPFVLGNHFVSIAGTGPIVGTAIALYWGWLPATLWVIFGSTMIGGLHDLGALVVSMRMGGRSIGDAASISIGPRLRAPYLALVILNNFLVVAIFCSIVSSILGAFPSAIFPLWAQIPLAALLGWLLRRKFRRFPSWASSVIALVVAFSLVVVGAYMPIRAPLPETIGGFPLSLLWTVLVLAYAYAASVTPVWFIYQSRNFLNGSMLAVVLVALAASALIKAPGSVAPAIAVHPFPVHSSNPSESQLPAADQASRPVIPFLFSTIACGALSGFHSLVCAGTTSKQLLRESDSVRVAYGAMLAEGVMAVISIVAISCGLGSRSNWERLYASWGSVQGFGSSLTAFVEGATSLSHPLGIPAYIRTCAAGFLVAAFATTTLGATIRVQRYVIAELVEQAPKQLRIIGNPYVSAAIAAVAGGGLSIAGGRAMALLWPIFGGINQLLASFTLLVVAATCTRAAVVYSVLAAIAFLTGFLAIVANMWKFGSGPNSDKWLLALAVLSILVIAWMVVEGIRALIPRFRARKRDPKSELEIPLTVIHPPPETE